MVRMKPSILGTGKPKEFNKGEREITRIEEPRRIPWEVKIQVSTD
jgi:hypothetical protein